MTQPKFSVGEVVILQSLARPEFNGEYIIEDWFTQFATIKCKITEQSLILSEFPGFAYLLEGLYLRSKGGVEEIWCESALRKKHHPSEMTFEGLIMSLNNPVNVEG